MSSFCLYAYLSCFPLLSCCLYTHTHTGTNAMFAQFLVFQHLSWCTLMHMILYDVTRLISSNPFETCDYTIVHSNIQYALVAKNSQFESGGGIVYTRPLSKFHFEMKIEVFK